MTRLARLSSVPVVVVVPPAAAPALHPACGAAPARRPATAPCHAHPCGPPAARLGAAAVHWAAGGETVAATLAVCQGGGRWEQRSALPAAPRQRGWLPYHRPPCSTSWHARARGAPAPPRTAARRAAPVVAHHPLLQRRRQRQQPHAARRRLLLRSLGGWVGRAPPRVAARLLTASPWRCTSRQAAHHLPPRHRCGEVAVAAAVEAGWM